MKVYINGLKINDSENDLDLSILRSSLEWLGSQTKFFVMLSPVSDERLQDHWSF